MSASFDPPLAESPSSLPLRCPKCGAQATLELRRSPDDPIRTEVESFTCPAGCTVDHESLRQIVGTSDA